MIKEKEYIWVKLLWAIIISGLLPVLGGLIIIYRGFINFNKKFVKMYKIKHKPIYVKDRRYKTGLRFEGMKQVKVPVKVEINNEQKLKARKKSYGYFVLGILSIITHLVIF